jgi:hypothetical protein
MKMKSICLSVAVLAILVMGSGPVWASGIISLNFSENSSNQIFAGNQLIGPLKTSSTNWNMSDNPATGTLAAGTKNNLIDDSGAATGVNVTWLSTNVWYNKDGTGNDEQKMAVGYLDDGETSTGVGVTVTFTNIPYSRYRVYGLISADTNQDGVPPTLFVRNFNVNGAWAYGGDESTYAVSLGGIVNNMAAHGEFWTRSILGTVAGNYWMIETGGSTLTITGLPKSGDARGSLGAVIIEASQNYMAHNPDPAIGGIGVALNKVLSWDAAQDPNAPGQPDPAITAHKVYMNNGTNDPNLYLVATIPATKPQAARVSYTPAVPLVRGGTYIWRVDEVMGSKTTQGMAWTYSTVSTSPALEPAFPADLTILSTETATFKVSAMNPYTFDATGMTYAWYKVGNTTTVLSTADTLVIPNAQGSNSGKYFCTVTLTSNGATVNSRTASLLVKQLVGHWPFDGNLNDVVAGNNGTTTNPPVFADGKIGQGVQFFKSTANPVKLPAVALTNLDFTLTWWSYEIDAAQDGALVASGTTGTEDFWYRRSGANFATFGIGTTVTFPRQNWYFHTYAYNSVTGQASWYINNSLLWSGGRAFTGFDSTDNLIFVGAYKTLAATRLYDGIIDDMRLYNYPLSTTEIGKLYAQGTGTTLCLKSVPNDLNGDCRVDFGDFALLASNWLKCNLAPESNCP